MLKLLGGERDEGGCMEERVGINASIQMFLKFAIWKYSQYNVHKLHMLLLCPILQNNGR